MLKPYSVTLDIYDTETKGTKIVYYRDDTDVYPLTIELLKKGEPFNLSGVGQAKITFRKPAKNKVVGLCDIVDVENGIVSYNVQTQEISCPGLVKVEITLYEMSGERLTANNFWITVKDDLDDDDWVESQSEYPILTQLITQVNQTESNIETKEAQRQSAESTRQANETMRQNNESIRQSNESARQEAEAARVSAEDDRASAEQDRITEENKRIENEAIRQSNEEARIEAEQAREERMAEVEDNVKQHELKILKVEKEINDYRDTIRQINVNQEPKQKVSGYGIISLPKNAASGQISDIRLYGNTEVDEEGNTKSTISASRLKSVGKNLFDKTLEPTSSYRGKKVDENDTGFTVKDTEDSITTASISFSKYLKPNTQYRISANSVRTGSTGGGIVLLDSNRSVLGGSSSSLNPNYTFTTTSDGYVDILFYARSGGNKGDYSTYTNIQLEEGTVATTYEPYTESELYIPDVGELRSTDTVRDEISYNQKTGQWVHIKRVDDSGVALPNPIITPINVSGTLLSYPKGTVFAEPVLPVAGIYTNDGIQVTNTDFPIESIERIYKIDFATGVETEVDVSQAVIAGDGLSFTHPELADGDIVFFIYYYAVEGTQLEITAEYYDSRYIVKDSETEQFYRWKISVTNGVPSLILEEV